MGLMISTISASGFGSWVQCEDCKAQAPRVDHADKIRAQNEAKKLAQTEGFVAFEKGRVWVCPACRIRRLPDKLKREVPGVCGRFGIPIPDAAPEPTPTRKRTRKK